MQTALKLFYATLFATFCFLLGNAYQARSHWFEYPVTVTITNSSGQPLKYLTLSHHGNGLKGILEIAPPPAGSKKTVQFFQPGEGGFTIETTLANGQVLKGIGGYIEAGYTIEKNISTTDIR